MTLKDKCGYVLVFEKSKNISRLVIWFPIMNSNAPNTTYVCCVTHLVSLLFENTTWGCKLNM
jgi:hypothetical protein